jgi:hypothetical protein
MPKWTVERVELDGMGYAGDAAFVLEVAHRPSTAIALVQSTDVAMRWMATLPEPVAVGLTCYGVDLPYWNGFAFRFNPPFYVIRKPDGYPAAYALENWVAQSLLKFLKKEK